MATECKITESIVRSWVANNTIDAHQPELLKLVCRHPDAVRKRLHEAVRVRRDKHSVGGLVAVLEDGSVESFSWRKAVGKSKHDTAARAIKEAFRNAVFDQTNAVRTQHGYVGRSEYHVGHGHGGTHSFHQLLNTFLDYQGLSLRDVQVHVARKPPLEYPVCQLQDTHVLESWQEFHRKHACLAIEHQHSNLRNLFIKEPSLNKP